MPSYKHRARISLDGTGRRIVVCCRTADDRNRILTIQDVLKDLGRTSPEPCTIKEAGDMMRSFRDKNRHKS